MSPRDGEGVPGTDALTATPSVATETVPRSDDETAPRSPFMSSDDVAARYGWSRRSVKEKTRLEHIPFRRLPGSRRSLFLEAELEAWENGAELEVRHLPRGGKIVRPASA